MSPTDSSADGSSAPGDGQPEREATPPAPRPIESLVGQLLLGRYEIESLIGSGILGQVYRAKRLTDGVRVAIKVLDERHRPDPNVVRRFLREAEAARALDHPSIVRTFEAGSDEKGRPFICSELLDGAPVTTVVRAGPLTLRRIVEPICEALSALSEAHRQGVLHRCLKPSNVLVREQEDHHFVTKVCDFGMGRLLKAVPGTATTKYGVACAAPEYMAPEQADSVEIDGRADVYAAGVILYELVTGQVPFTGANARAILDKHKSEPLAPPSKLRLDRRIPRELETVCFRALEKDPKQRYHSPREMRTALRQTLDLLGARADAPIEAPASDGPGGSPSRDRLTMPGEQLHSSQKVGVGAALLLLVSGVLWLSAPNETDQRRTKAGVISSSQASAAAAAEAVAEGKRRLDEGDVASALVVLTRAHAALGETAEVSRWLGEALLRSGEQARGRELLQRYLSLQPEAEDRRTVEALLDGHL